MDKVSIIIPVFNEELLIGDCLASLCNQTYKNIQIIVVDDGSTDATLKIANKFKDLKIITQEHKGPGSARNLGASKSDGRILVFVDADMTFDKNFIEDLIKPIQSKKAIGTFSKNELVSNFNNKWSICWNINRNVPRKKMLPENYPDQAPVFRAILKREFEKVHGFETSGDYTDDWSLSEKLGEKSQAAKGAVYYHSNPSSAREVMLQARWIGKNRFISGSLVRKLKSLVLYSLPFSVVIGVAKSILTLYPHFLIFKVIYDLSIFASVIKSFTQKAKFK